MLLWKWCDLLSRGQREEAARHLANHLRVSLQEKKLIFFGPGYLPNLGDGRIDAAQASQILSDHPAAAEFLHRLLPPDLADPPDRSIAEDVDSAILAEWINDAELSRLLFENLSDEDYWPGVVQRLQELRRANARKFIDTARSPSHSHWSTTRRYPAFGRIARSTLTRFPSCKCP